MSRHPHAHPSHSIDLRRGRALRCISGALAALLAIGTVADAHAGHVRATGKIKYEDQGLHPLAYVPIRLWDADADLRDLIDAEITGSDGSFDLSGTATDPWLGKNRPVDPYVEIVYDNDRVEIRNLIGIRYVERSAVRRNTEGHIQYGTLVTSETAASNLFTRALRQYKYFVAVTGDTKVPGNHGEVEVVYPAVTFGVPYTTVRGIQWAAEDDDWDAVYHEFGHRLRHAADGGFLHFLFDVARFGYARFHTPTMETNEGFAFNEGWAEYHATLLDEYERGQVEGWGDLQGDDVEGKVAYKLYQLARSCGGFKPMWRTLKDAGVNAIHSYAEFEAAFMQQNSGCQLLPMPQPFARSLPKSKAPPRAPIPLARQQDAVRQQLDRIDQRSGPELLQPRYRPEDLAKLDPASARTIDRVQISRLKHARGWDTAARAAQRRAVLAIKPLTEASAADGSHEASVKAARDAFIGEVVQPRLHQISELRAQIDHERKQPHDPGLTRYLAGLADKYAAQENALRAALASRGQDDTTIPVDILPPSFIARLTRAKE